MNGKVRLRDVEASDLALFFDVQRDPVAVAMVMFKSRDQTEFAQHWAELLADDSCLKKTIIVESAVSAEEQIVGHIGSWTSNGKREIGYWIDRAFWGRGIGTEAVSAFVLLEQTRPLYGSVAKHNAGSIRVLQKCGFVHFEDDGPTHILLKLDAKL